jgi:hypothetical protein
MALANDMTALLNKIEKRLGLIPLTPHLPKEFSKEKWADTVVNDTMQTFSRYFPHKFPLVVNDETCFKRYEDPKGSQYNGKTVWYYIKDEVLEGVKLLGIQDIDWTDLTTNNSSLASSLGGGMYFPSIPCPEATFNDLISLQFAADVASLYNRGIFLDFEYPNKFSIKGIGNTNYDLESFVVILLVQHRSLSTISPTKMETFEALAQADIANFLWKNLRYYDGLETVFLNINLMLSELQDEANKRDSIIDTLKESYVSTSNDQCPIIFTV